MDVGKQEPGRIIGRVVEKRPAKDSSGVHQLTIVSGPRYDRFVFYASARATDSWWHKVPNEGDLVRISYELRAELRATVSQGKARGQFGQRPVVVDAEAVGTDASGIPPLPVGVGGDALTRRRAA